MLYLYVEMEYGKVRDDADRPFIERFYLGRTAWSIPK